ncbi:MAG: hypothetical protein RL375_3089 [Pseudomonadota bacterium]|jgi:hypothetical protein
MKYYQTPDGAIWAFEDDGSQDHLVRPNMVARTAEQVAAAHDAQRDAKAEALAQIRGLEVANLMPRATREFMLMTLEAQATPERLAQLPAYVKLKAFDTQIAGLRAIVRGGT